MRKIVETGPSIIFILFFLAGMYLKMNGQSWVNSFVIGITGLSVYSFVIIMVEGLASGMRMVKHMDVSSKIFYTLHVSLWIFSATLAIYLMAHN